METVEFSMGHIWKVIIMLFNFPWATEFGMLHRCKNIKNAQFKYSESTVPSKIIFTRFVFNFNKNKFILHRRGIEPGKHF